MFTITFQVPGSPPQTVTVGAASFHVGSSETCDVRLPATVLPPLACEVRRTISGLAVSAIAVPVVLAGRAIVPGTRAGHTVAGVAGRVVLLVGPVTLTVAWSTALGDAAEIAKDKAHVVLEAALGRASLVAETATVRVEDLKKAASEKLGQVQDQVKLVSERFVDDAKALVKDAWTKHGPAGSRPIGSADGDAAADVGSPDTSVATSQDGKPGSAERVALSPADKPAVGAAASDSLAKHGALESPAEATDGPASGMLRPPASDGETTTLASAAYATEFGMVMTMPSQPATVFDMDRDVIAAVSADAAAADAGRSATAQAGATEPQPTAAPDAPALGTAQPQTAPRPKPITPARPQPAPPAGDAGGPGDVANSAGARGEFATPSEPVEISVAAAPRMRRSRGVSLPVPSMPDLSGVAGVFGRKTGKKKSADAWRTPTGGAAPSARAAGAPAEAAARDIERAATVRYYRQMNPFRNYPLLVVFTEPAVEVAQPTQARVGQVRADAPLQVTRDDPIITVIPRFPGCICVPDRLDVDLTPGVAEAQFWITPAAVGDLGADAAGTGADPMATSGASVELWYRGKRVDQVFTPSRVVTQVLARVCALAGFASPVFFGTLSEAGYNPKAEALASVAQWAGEVGPLGPMWTLGLMAMGLLFAVAAGLYLAFKPKRSDPLRTFLSFDVTRAATDAAPPT